MNPVAFEFDEGLFAKNVRSARKGATPRPSRMAVEHLRPLLDNPIDVLFFLMIDHLVQGRAPEVAVQTIRLGRLTALRKPDGALGALWLEMW